MSVPAGFLVWIYSPFINMSGIECFFGVGGSIFVGLGAAVLGRSPLIELIPIVNLHADFWIMVRTGTSEGNRVELAVPKKTQIHTRAPLLTYISLPDTHT